MSQFLYDEEITLSQVLAGQNLKLLKSAHLIVDKTEGCDYMSLWLSTELYTQTCLLVN